MIEYESLSASNSAFINDLESAAVRVIRSGWYILGKELEQFEESFSRFIGTRHCIGVANGLDALTLSLQSLSLPLDSEILVAANTYIATILAILRAGHQPVLVEPDPDTFNISAKEIEKSITRSTRAICVTHLFGKVCRMDLIHPLAQKYDLKIIEDCAQSHGAHLSGKLSGSFGDLGCFSFYPTKNLGAFGDAGAITTNDDALAQKLRCLRNYGSDRKYYNKYVGTNSRLDEIQAATLSVKLKHVYDIIDHKQKLATLYLDSLPSWLKLPRISSDEFDVHHIFPVRTENRDKLRAWLLKHNVKTEIHYPIPPHRQEAMKGILKGSYPVTDLLHETELSLPISLGTTEADVITICNIIKKFKQSH